MDSAVPDDGVRQIPLALRRGLWLLFGLGIALTTAVCVAFLHAPENGESVSGYATAAIEMLAVSVLAILLLLFGQRLSSVKIGGVEISLQEAANEANRKEAENKQLQARLLRRSPDLTDALEPQDASVQRKGPDLPAPTVGNDTQKGRFGRRAVRDGFSLLARFPSSFSGSRIAKVELIVVGTQGQVVNGPVRFYLDSTFDPGEIDVPAQNGKAALEILTIGGFTVGAWLADTGTLLELDLAEVPGAPPIVRDN